MLEKIAVDTNNKESVVIALCELYKKEAENRLSYLQGLLIASSTLLGILVSFHMDYSPCNIASNVSYCLSMTLLPVGILCGYIALRKYHALLDPKIRKVEQSLLKLSAGETVDVSSRFLLLYPRPTVSVYEKASYIVLILCLIFLAVSSSLYSFGY